MCTNKHNHVHFTKFNDKNRFEDIIKIPFLNHNFLPLSTVAVFSLRPTVHPHYYLLYICAMLYAIIKPVCVRFITHPTIGLIR